MATRAKLPGPSMASASMPIPTVQKTMAAIPMNGPWMPEKTSQAILHLSKSPPNKHTKGVQTMLARIKNQNIGPCRILVIQTAP